MLDYESCFKTLWTSYFNVNIINFAFDSGKKNYSVYIHFCFLIFLPVLNTMINRIRGVFNRAENVYNSYRALIRYFKMFEKTMF